MNWDQIEGKWKQFTGSAGNAGANSPMMTGRRWPARKISWSGESRSIAMGLGGYLAAKSDAEHYQAERKREETEVKEKTRAEIAEVAEVFRSYGVTEDESRPIVDALRKRPEAWVDFMMRFELGLEKPDPKRALLSALTIAGAYIVGGFIPLGPYIVLFKASTALVASAAITLVALAIFGYVKGHFTGAAPLRSSIQTVLIGGLAAGVAFFIARAIS
jgi:VIT1/CCC1 family predicted Fe2+/Mn2+ transporter